MQNDEIIEENIEGITGGHVCLSHKGSVLLLLDVRKTDEHRNKYPKHNIQELDLVPPRNIRTLMDKAREDTAKEVFDKLEQVWYQTSSKGKIAYLSVDTNLYSRLKKKYFG